MIEFTCNKEEKTQNPFEIWCKACLGLGLILRREHGEGGFSYYNGLSTNLNRMPILQTCQHCTNVVR